MSDYPTAALLALHGLAATIWVGGMFFAYVILRKAAGVIDPAPERLRLWADVFKRFFPWVTAAVIILPATGYYLIFDYFGGFSQSAIHIHWMHGTGLLMIAFYGYLLIRPYARFRLAVAEERWAEGAHALVGVRRIIQVNLMLGLFTMIIGMSGRLWAWIP